jgi:hypothetical protein
LKSLQGKLVDPTGYETANCRNVICKKAWQSAEMSGGI